MFRLISGIVGFVGATMLFWCGIAYTVYAPPGWPNYQASWLVFHATLHLPYAGAVQAADAKAASAIGELNQCVTSSQQLEQGIAAQNRAVLAMKVQAEAMTANAQRAVTKAQATVATAQLNAQAILAITPAPANLQCAVAETLIRSTVK